VYTVERPPVSVVQLLGCLILTSMLDFSFS
jgi:hypothetical protein